MADGMIGGLERPHDLLAETVNDPRAPQRHELHIARLARFEPHRCAGGNIEPHAACRFAIKAQAGIGLVEMKMRADLNGSIAGIGDFQGNLCRACIEFNIAGFWDDFAGNHGLTEWVRARSPTWCRRGKWLRPGY